MAKKKKKPVRRAKPAKKKSGKPSVRHTDYNRNRVQISIGSISSHIKQAKKGLETKLADKLLEAYKAPNAKKRKAVNKQIQTLKTQLKKLS